MRIGHRMALVLVVNVAVAMVFVGMGWVGVTAGTRLLHEAFSLHQLNHDVEAINGSNLRVLLGIRQYLATLELEKVDQIKAEAGKLEDLIGGIIRRDPVLQEQLASLQDLIRGILPAFEEVLELNVALRDAYDKAAAAAQNATGLISIVRSNAREMGHSVIMPPLDRVAVRFQETVSAVNRLLFSGTGEREALADLQGVEKALPVLAKLAGNDFQAAAIGKTAANLVDFRDAVEEMSHKLAARERLVREVIDGRQEQIDLVIGRVLAFSAQRENDVIQNLSRALPEIGRTLFILTVIFLGFGGFLTWAIARSITRPLAILDRAIQRQSEGLPDLELPDEDARDEIAGMARTLRRAAQLQEDKNRLIKDLHTAREETERSMEALAQAKEMAESASRAKSEFLAAMSHELRTPLHQIMGFTQLATHAELGSLSDKQRRYLDLSIQSSRHLLSLINDVLDIAKIEAGKTTLQASNVNLVSLLEETVVMLRERAEENDIEISLKVAEVPQTIVADDRMLRQILYNLLSNATKFTGRGGSILLTARGMPWTGGRPATRDGRDPGLPPGAGGRAGNGGDFVEVTVSDTGVGLQREDLERVFSPFEQAGPALARKSEGTGLGLALTREFVQLHGGRIWAESEGLGKGCRFCFVIPVAQPGGDKG